MASSASNAPATGTPFLVQRDFATAVEIHGRQLAFTRDVSHFALTVRDGQEIYEYASLETPVPLAICDTAAAFAARWSGLSCMNVGAASGWSPRWSPREHALVYLDAAGVMVRSLADTSSTRVLETPRPAGVDW